MENNLFFKRRITLINIIFFKPWETIFFFCTFNLSHDKLSHLFSVLCFFSLLTPSLLVAKSTNFWKWNLLKFFFIHQYLGWEILTLDISIENNKRCQPAKLQDSYQNLLKYWGKLIISYTAHYARPQLVKINYKA